MMDEAQQAALEDFDREHIGLSKGSLSFALIVTRRLRGAQFPIDADDYRTE
jgi:hypothetical protein